MLIAIMGDTFGKNNEIKEMAQCKSHLRFVIDNWWTNPIKDRDQIQYLICAFLKDDDNEDSEILQKVRDEVQLLKGQMSKNYEKLNAKLGAILNKWNIFKS